MSDNIVWGNRYIVGIKEIDSQHKKIFQQLNKLDAAVDAEKNQRDLSFMLSDVFNQFRYHFTSEEVYLLNHHDHDRHHQLHCDFTERIQEYEAQSRKDANFDFKGIITLLSNWHKEHILEVDVQYFQYLLDKTIIESLD
jgi:hemerythrin